MRIDHRRFTTLLLSLIALPAFTACSPGGQQSAGITITGTIANTSLDEASGMQAAENVSDVYFLHNDDGKAELFAVGPDGADLGRISVAGAENRDWEDISSVPSDKGPLLVIADTGDNFAQYDSVRLYFVPEPEPGADGRYSGSQTVQHVIDLEYPDGPRDCESVAWDPHSDRIYLLSKRDQPAQIYSIAREDALRMDHAKLPLQGVAYPFRAPTQRDLVEFGQRDGPWVSQPTGLDFSSDGRKAVVISYRSLYLFSREEGEAWPAAFGRKPLEFEGPGSRKEEAVTFARGDETIMVTTEGIPAPVYQFRLLEEAP